MLPLTFWKTFALVYYSFLSKSCALLLQRVVPFAGNSVGSLFFLVSYTSSFRCLCKCYFFKEASPTPDKVELPIVRYHCAMWFSVVVLSHVMCISVLVWLMSVFLAMVWVSLKPGWCLFPPPLHVYCQVQPPRNVCWMNECEWLKLRVIACKS